MELRPLFLCLSIFYFISCANSATIYNDELSENEYISRVLSRLPRSPNIWNLGEERRIPQQKKDFSEEQQEGLRHENIIYISLAGNSERSKESSEEKHESSGLWSILGKTTDFFVPPFVKAILPRTIPPKFDPPPYYSGSVQNRLWNNEDRMLVNARTDRPPFIRI